MTAVIVFVALQSSEYNITHFYEDYDTSNNHTILAPNELVGDSGGTTSQAKSNGALCFTGAISAVCLACFMNLIQSVYDIGLR